MRYLTLLNKQGVGMSMGNMLPAQSFQTAFLPFDSTLGTATFVRAGGAINPDTGLWANENQILNSAVFVTQNVTTVATTYTLSMKGTGVITIGGTGSGVLTGTGANDRVSITFTPTAGTCSFTLSGGAGTVAEAQLQRGSAVGNYLVTTSAAKYDQPRYVTGRDSVAGHAVLVEEASTQLLAYSNKFNASPWVSVGTPTPTQNEVDPWGNANAAWTMTDNDAALIEGLPYSPIAIPANTAAYTASYYVKATGSPPSSYTLMILVFSDATNAIIKNVGVLIDTYTGALVNRQSSGVIVAPDSSSCVRVGAYWRVTVTGNNINGVKVHTSFYPAAATAFDGTLAVAAAGSVIMGYAQLEALPYATSYIPNTASSGTVTRAAEYAPQATSGLITQDAAATIQGWWKPEGVAAGKTQTIWSTYTGAADYTRIAYSGTQLIFTKAKTGQATETIAYTVTITPNTWYHAAVTIAADGTALMYHNGALVGTNGTTPAFKPVIATNMQYGAFNGTLQINGALDNFRFFNRVLTAGEILTYANKGK